MTGNPEPATRKLLVDNRSRMPPARITCAYPRTAGGKIHWNRQPATASCLLALLKLNPLPTQSIIGQLVSNRPASVAVMKIAGH